jgi:DNA-directed RNA polymerase specialized sigma24 family protein
MRAVSSSRPPLSEVDRLSTPEICKILEITRTNFGVMLYRARNRLRECLEEKGMGRSDADL